ncbi:MAG: N-acetylmuramoyl-L-alanine amidase [Acidimicrobiales bacterium]|nr:N-acetylmuramoyl-L-alanine amidase [Acidimicrobiales bacterium]
MSRNLRIAIALLVVVALLVVAGVVARQVLVRFTAEPDGPLVAIDAGHGGSFNNVGIGGIQEEDINLAMAKRLRKVLLGRGYRVVMTRSEDANVAEKPIPSWRYLGAPGKAWGYGIDPTPSKRPLPLKSDLQARVNIANRAGADVFVSVHNNATRDSTTRGTETYAYRRDVPGMALAASVQDAITASTGNQSRGSHGSGLYVLRWTNMPAVLVEGAYLTNQQDADLASSAAYQRKLAEGVADGLDRWFASHPLRKAEPQLAADAAASLATTVSAASYPEGAKVAVVLTDKSTSLGPTAAALAASHRAPLLLASASGISRETADELRRLNPERVVVLSDLGTADRKRVEAAIRSAVSNQVTVHVIIAESAQSAAAQVAELIEVPESGVVAIVDAGDTTALAALAPYAARQNAPVLLSDDGELGEEGSAFLSANRGQIARVLAVGSSAEPAQPKGWPVTVVSSADPDELAAKLLARSDPPTSKAVLAPVVVDAETTPDLFTASVEAARRTAPLVQLRRGVLGPYSREFLANRAESVDGFLVLRDDGSISPVAESALRKTVAH